MEAFKPIQHPQRLSGSLATHIVRRLRRFTFQGRENDVVQGLVGQGEEEDARSMKVVLKGV